MTRYVVGIDMSSSDFHVCLVARKADLKTKVLGRKMFKNTPSGFDLLLSWIGKKEPKYIEEGLFIMEATGIYYENLAWYLHQEGQKVSVVVPSRAKHYLKSKGFASKTDQLDAEGLGIMGLEQSLALWQPFSPELYHLRSLTRHLERLQKIKVQLSNQLHALRHGMFLVQEVINSLEETISSLNEQIKEMKHEIERSVKAAPLLAEKIGLLTSIKGVGIQSAATILAETNGFTLFTSRKQLTSYAGYDVLENQSGKRVGKTKISKQGNSHIRRAMYFLALNVVRYQVGNFSCAELASSVADLQARIHQRTGIKMKGYVAVQRKLLCLLYTLWKKNEPFKEPKKKTAQSTGEWAALDKFTFETLEKKENLRLQRNFLLS